MFQSEDKHYADQKTKPCAWFFDLKIFAIAPSSRQNGKIREAVLIYGAKYFSVLTKKLGQALQGLILFSLNAKILVVFEHFHEHLGRNVHLAAGLQFFLALFLFFQQFVLARHVAAV